MDGLAARPAWFPYLFGIRALECDNRTVIKAAQRRCAQCDEPLGYSGRGRPNAYCTAGCKAEAARERERHWRVLGQMVEARAQTTIKEN